MTLNLNNSLTITPSRKRRRNLKENFVYSNDFVEENSSINEDKCESLNPYEVVRKPPKKKSKRYIEQSCFTNEGLDINLPEKKINPFEVKRPSPKLTTKHCFTNPGLSINVRSDENINFNPFEILREKNIINIKNGIENPALEPTKSFGIALPFTPNINCRIDFSKMIVENTTPSKLFEEKLVLSPNNKITTRKFKRSLSVISEEVDIGKELDSYQLELENSINEAKMKKNYKEGIEQKNKFNENEDEKMDEREDTDEISYDMKSVSFNKESIPDELDIKNSTGNCMKPKLENLENEDDFIEPTPFVRCYRKPIQNMGKIEIKNEEKKSLTKSVRKSFRNIINAKSIKEGESQNENKIKNGSHIFETIRRSLRKKPKTVEENLTPNQHNISIIDNCERKIFRSADEDCLDGNLRRGISFKKFIIRDSLRSSKRLKTNNIF